jgi:hypothetical protein
VKGELASIASSVSKHAPNRPTICNSGLDNLGQYTSRKEREKIMIRTVRAARFLMMGPIILGVLVVINLMTSPGHWWVQWPALGICLAWLISLLRVLRAVAVLGGLAALFAYLRRR